MTEVDKYILLNFNGAMVLKFKGMIVDLDKRKIVEAGTHAGVFAKRELLSVSKNQLELGS